MTYYVAVVGTENKPYRIATCKTEVGANTMVDVLSHTTPHLYFEVLTDRPTTELKEEAPEMYDDFISTLMRPHSAMQRKPKLVVITGGKS